MNRLNVFQRNNLITGNNLAAEVSSSSPVLRAFVVIGAYLQIFVRRSKPSKSLNVEQRNMRFWIRKYEVSKSDIEADNDIVDQDLYNSIYLDEIQSVEELETELAKYIQDFSLMEVSWKVDNPLP